MKKIVARLKSYGFTTSMIERVHDAVNVYTRDELPVLAEGRRRRREEEEENGKEAALEKALTLLALSVVVC